MLSVIFNHESRQREKEMMLVPRLFIQKGVSCLYRAMMKDGYLDGVITDYEGVITLPVEPICFVGDVHKTTEFNSIQISVDAAKLIAAQSDPSEYERLVDCAMLPILDQVKAIAPTPKCFAAMIVYHKSRGFFLAFAAPQVER